MRVERSASNLSAASIRVAHAKFFSVRLVAQTKPTISSLWLISGPPELPGLIAASVCNALINEVELFSSPAVTGRSFALMIPWVTVPDNPSGEPKAITESPT